ncbi:YigZ family protein [Profundibacterium mesophilum]|uniref:Thymidylate synthase n=1 Tax=Profundibacterium mesophilum KAUST100406-0324 TaxID=1037889 RepID=A0A921NRY6_9RHOB|nr:YigZ family protein [Profundibacterium mesophilum]KAF0676637.1 thymidylate synthase [Profundibacterium mesophilum KAUST100406-0324]
MALRVLTGVLNDRGSKYAVSGGPARDRAGAEALRAELLRRKKFAKATHNSWALLPSSGDPVKADDSEAGAGMVILRMLEREGLHDHMVIVTRWFGGTHLGGDRFRHVQDCVRHYLAQRGAGD